MKLNIFSKKLLISFILFLGVQSFAINYEIEIIKDLKHNRDVDILSLNNSNQVFGRFLGEDTNDFFIYENKQVQIITSQIESINFQNLEYKFGLKESVIFEGLSDDQNIYGFFISKEDGQSTDGSIMGHAFYVDNSNTAQLITCPNNQYTSNLISFNTVGNFLLTCSSKDSSENNHYFKFHNGVVEEIILPITYKEQKAYHSLGGLTTNGVIFGSVWIDSNTTTEGKIEMPKVPYFYENGIFNYFDKNLNVDEELQLNGINQNYIQVGVYRNFHPESEFIGEEGYIITPNSSNGDYEKIQIENYSTRIIGINDNNFAIGDYNLDFENDDIDHGFLLKLK